VLQKRATLTAPLFTRRDISTLTPSDRIKDKENIAMKRNFIIPNIGKMRKMQHAQFTPLSTLAEKDASRSSIIQKLGFCPLF
jgi:hypothetical protein